MEALFFFPCFFALPVGIGLLVVVGLVFASQQRKKRTEAWRRAAESIGLAFHGESNDVLAQYGRLKLLSRGSGRRVYNAVMGDAGEMAITLADFRYTTGSGKNQSTHVQTICILREQSLQLTHCFLRPQVAFFDFLGRMFGGQDINFDEDPAFSGAYVLQGENEAAVRELFDGPIRSWFANQRGRNFHFEAIGDTLMFHTGKRVDPGQIRPLMEQAVQIKNLLAGR